MEAKATNARNNLPYGVLITMMLRKMGIKFLANSKFLKHGEYLHKNPKFDGNCFTFHLIAINAKFSSHVITEEEEEEENSSK